MEDVSTGVLEKNKKYLRSKAVNNTSLCNVQDTYSSNESSHKPVTDPDSFHETTEEHIPNL